MAAVAGEWRAIHYASNEDIADAMIGALQVTQLEIRPADRIAIQHATDYARIGNGIYVRTSTHNRKRTA